MFLSIVIPFFNPMPYFSKLIDALLIQSLAYCRDSSMEIIFINDGSTDDAISILEKYEACKNVNIITIDNGGVANARNIGLDKSNGLYVWFVDADDYIPLNVIDRVINYLKSLKYSPDLIFANFYVFNDYNNENNVLYRSEYDYSIGKSYENIEDSFNVLFNKIKIGYVIWNQLFKIDFLHKNAIYFDSSFKVSEDLMFKINAVYHASQFAFIDDEIYGYRVPHGRKTLSQAYPTAAELDSLINAQADWFNIFDIKYPHEQGSRYMKLLFSESLNMWMKYLETTRNKFDSEYIIEMKKRLERILGYLPEGTSALYHRGI